MFVVQLCHRRGTKIRFALIIGENFVLHQHFPFEDDFEIFFWKTNSVQNACVGGLHLNRGRTIPSKGHKWAPGHTLDIPGLGNLVPEEEVMTQNQEVWRKTFSFIDIKP